MHFELAHPEGAHKTTSPSPPCRPKNKSTRFYSSSLGSKNLKHFGAFKVEIKKMTPTACVGELVGIILMTVFILIEPVSTTAGCHEWEWEVCAKFQPCTSSSYKHKQQNSCHCCCCCCCCCSLLTAHYTPPPVLDPCARGFTHWLIHRWNFFTGSEVLVLWRLTPRPSAPIPNPPGICYRISEGVHGLPTSFCWVWETYTGNDYYETDELPSPRLTQTQENIYIYIYFFFKWRLGHIFPPDRKYFFVVWDWFCYGRKQTTRNPTQPNFSADTLLPLFTGVHINQDLILCVKKKVYMVFWAHRGFWLLSSPVILPSLWSRLSTVTRPGGN